jgi:hypothetical protein
MSIRRAQLSTGLAQRSHPTFLVHYLNIMLVLALALHRIFYSMPEYWDFIKVLIQSLPVDLDNDSLQQITAGGLQYDRYLYSDVANLSDLDAFFDEELQFG